MRKGFVELEDPGSLAPVLGARRDGSARAETSRDLLITVLGEFVLPEGGQAWTQSLVAALDLLGVRNKAARQALARMQDRGWLASERVGRRTRWTLTDQASALLAQGADRIYTFGSQTKDWDGRWVVLLASVPERDRAVRYRMAQGLGWAGFGSLGNGVWLSPWVDHEPMAVAALAGLDIEATSLLAEVGRLGEGPELAAQAWDLPELADLYDRFVTDADKLTDAAGDPAAVAALAGLVHRWRKFPLLDPELPAELLPPDWPGPLAAARFARSRNALLPAARRWWQAQEPRLAR